MSCGEPDQFANFPPGEIFVTQPHVSTITPEQYQAACNLCERLILKRMEYCNHLAIENCAPELLARILAETHLVNLGITRKPTFEFPELAGR